MWGRPPPAIRGAQLRRLLTQLDRKLALRLGHLAPEFLQIILQRLVVGLFMQSKCKPTVGSRQVSRRAGPGRVKCAHGDHCFRIGLFGRRLQQLQTAIAILARAVPIDIPFRLHHRIDWLGRCGLALSRFRRWWGFSLRRLCIGIGAGRLRCSVSRRVGIRWIGLSCVRRSCAVLRRCCWWCTALRCRRLRISRLWIR
jgi:hypothetical protein